MSPSAATSIPEPEEASVTARTLLDTLETSYELGPRWSNSPLAWTKRLLPAQKGRVGEQLFAALCNAAAIPTGPRTGSGHDLTCGAYRVEVKFGTLHDTDLDDPDRVEWLQLRPGGDFTHVALLCACPDHVHLWVTTRHTALALTVGQHGGKDATETRMLAIDPHSPPPALGPDYGEDLDQLAVTLSQP